jgi:CRISPR-associated protein Cst2
VDDFGTMSRHEGDPVPHEHQFYHATLKGLFSLDLSACGTFSYRNKTGFRNLDSVREALAQDVEGVEHDKDAKTYRLPQSMRIERIKALFEGLAHLEGGAKQTTHYTDVSPALVIMAVTKGGNHIFGHVIGANRQGQPIIKTDALQEALQVFSDTLLSPVYVGWVRGYLDEEREKFLAWKNAYLKEANADVEKASPAGAGATTPDTEAKPATAIEICHPREAFQKLAADFDKPGNTHWLE